MISEAQKWPTSKSDYDDNYLRLFGLCNANNCPRSWHCYRNNKGAGQNNKTWIPMPDDYDNCKWFVEVKNED